MTEGTTSEHFLTEEQSRSLRVLLNMIIPPNQEKGMPAAGELDFMGYVREYATDQLDAIQRELDFLNRVSHEQYQHSFADLAPNDRKILIDRLRKKNAQFAQSIVVQTMGCYYQNDKVVTALGMEARPPFPKGHEVVSGDLSLLDPVRKRKPIYREV